MTVLENPSLKGRRILIAVTGSIAAIKIPSLVSDLFKSGAIVRCVITPNATNFISPLVLSTLSRNCCYQDQNQWIDSQSKPLHIELAEWAELIVVAPLSATSLSKLANGNAEGLLASILLATQAQIIVAAAMNTSMWSNDAVRKNWEYIQNQPNFITLEPSQGLLACDRIGDGKMISLEIIKFSIESALIHKNNNRKIKKDLKGLKLLITAGATIEDIDPARYISNRSSGMMGIFLAQAAKIRGAEVDLIHGQIQLTENWLEGLNIFPARSAEQMQTIIKDIQPKADVIAMAAAIGDLRRKDGISLEKVSKDLLLKSLAEDLQETPDLLQEIILRKKSNQLVIGFSASTGNDEEIKSKGECKRLLKGCDLLFANPIDRPGQGFGENLNGGFLLSTNKTTQTIQTTSKLHLAHQLLDAICGYRYEFCEKV